MDKPKNVFICRSGIAATLEYWNPEHGAPVVRGRPAAADIAGGVPTPLDQGQKMQTFEEECEEVVQRYCKYSIVLLFYVLRGSFALLNTVNPLCLSNLDGYFMFQNIQYFSILYNIFQFFYCLSITVR